MMYPVVGLQTDMLTIIHEIDEMEKSHHNLAQ